MFATIVLLPLIMLFILSRSKNSSWRISLLSTLTAWTFILVTITELLSLFKLLSFGFVLFSWMAVSVILGFILYKGKHKFKSQPILNYILPFDAYLKHIKANKNKTLILAFAYIFIISSCLLAIAIVAPPNNWDSMTYHMSRVANWIQNRSVAHYPTYIIRQVDTPPLSGFIITHLQILSGGDRFANLVQWSSMLGSLVAVSLIAKKLGANLYGQLASALICLTIPMGILQASSTQNDYVVSFWIVCFVYYTLCFLSSSKISENQSKPSRIFNLGTSLGLAILTKGTAYIYALPFCIWLTISSLKKRDVQSFLITCRELVAIALITILINIFHWYRNIAIWSNPLGISSKVTRNELYSFPAIVSNFIRHTSLHLVTIHRGLNNLANSFIGYIYDNFLGIDINDSRITFINTKFSIDLPPSNILHEDFAGNFVNLVLIFLCIGAYLLQRKWRGNYISLIYLISSTSAYILFCFLIKWQPWASRLHLPSFVLFSAFCGYVISTCLKEKKVIYNYLFTLLIILSLPYVIFNSSRPMILSGNLTFPPNIIFNSTREEMYFTNRSDIKELYRETANFLNSHSCNNIGMITGGNTWEYPLREMLLKQNQDYQIGHIILSENQEYKENQPCAIIVVEFDSEEYLKRMKKDFQKSWESNFIKIYLAKNDKV